MMPVIQVHRFVLFFHLWLLVYYICVHFIRTHLSPKIPPFAVASQRLTRSNLL